MKLRKRKVFLKHKNGSLEFVGRVLRIDNVRHPDGWGLITMILSTRLIVTIRVPSKKSIFKLEV